MTRSRFIAITWRSCAAAALMAIGFLACTIAYGEGYITPTVSLPLYGASGTPAIAPAAAADNEQPEWAKRLESKLDKVLKILDELDEKPPAAGTEAPAAGGELFFRADLTAVERGRIVRKVSKGGAVDGMPPPDKPQLTPEEKTAMVAAFSGKAADEVALASAGARCVSCHSPIAALKQGDGFALFAAKAGK